jgi:hypothetical protein
MRYESTTLLSSTAAAMLPAIRRRRTKTLRRDLVLEDLELRELK